MLWVRRMTHVDVTAFSTPNRPDWRWRIVTYAGELVEESYETFPSISTAVSDGNRRMRELDIQDVSERAPMLYRSSTYRRAR